MDIFNSFPYITYYFFLFLLFKFELKQKKQLTSIRLWQFVGFIFFFGLRGYVISDASVYYLSFNSNPEQFQWIGGFKLDEYTFEPAFKLLERIVYLIFKNYFAFQFINSLIDFILLDIIFRKYTKFYTLGFLCFFVLEGYMYEVNLLRNMKSILLFIISIQYIIDRKIWKYFLINIFGMMFHFSAIIYLPLYWFLNKQLPKKLILVIIALGIIIPLFGIKIFHILPFFSILNSSRIIDYFDNSNDVYQIGFRLIERSMICLFIYQHYKQRNENYLRIFFNLYLIYFISFNLLYEIPIFPSRVAGLFLPAAWIIVPHIITEFKKISFSSKKQILLFYGMLILILATIHNTQRYSNIIFCKESYEEYIVRYENALIN